VNHVDASKYITAIFSTILIASGAFTAYLYTLPTTEIQTITASRTSHDTNYDYTASLRSNIFYNKTTLRPGEGLLYSAIVRYVNLSLGYNFTAIPPPYNVTTSAEVEVALESPNWVRPLRENETLELLSLNGSLPFTLTINQTRLMEIADIIDEEVGLSSNTYYLNIKATIRTKANVLGETMIETFKPTLTVSFIQGGEQGNIISIENVNQTQTNEETFEREIVDTSLLELRRNAFNVTVIACVPVPFSAALYLQFREKREKRQKPLKKIIAPYQELITETHEEPPATATIINLNTLEDLAKTAEILARPILHAHTDHRHTFYVIDEGTTYQYKTQPPEET